MSDMRRKKCQKCYKQYIKARKTMEPSLFSILQQCQFSEIKPDTAICKLVLDTTGVVI